MGRSCSVWGCSVGYYHVQGEKKKYSVYRFPKDPKELKEWLRCLPNNVSKENITDNMGICGRHWQGLRDEDMKTYGKTRRPIVPPNFFGPYNDTDDKNKIPLSVLPTPPAKRRRTTKATSAPRSDEPKKSKKTIVFSKLFVIYLSTPISAYLYSIVCSFV